MVEHEGLVLGAALNPFLTLILNNRLYIHFLEGKNRKLSHTLKWH